MAIVVLPTVRITWVVVVDIPMLAAASIKNAVIAIAIAVIPEGAFGVVVASPMTSMVAVIVVARIAAARIAATEVILGEAFRRANIWVAGVLSTVPLIVAILTVVITVVTAAVGAVGVTL